MWFYDCAAKLPKARPHKSLFRSCALPILGTASEQLQDGAMPLINGLDKAKLPANQKSEKLSRIALSWR